MNKKELDARLDALIYKCAETDMKIQKLQKWSEELAKTETTMKPEEWISVAYREGVWIGKREDGSFISTKGEADKWIWKPATEAEIEQFNLISSNPDEEPQNE